MQRLLRYALALAFATFATLAYADSYSDSVATFKRSVESSSYFGSSYGYAVFPTVGKAGFVVGGAYGKGRVYAAGRYVGDTSIKQISAGAQIGGQAYSQIIFFENRRAFDDFTSGNFEFSADASAVAITAGAQASAGTTGANLGASLTKNEASTKGGYRNGMAVFTITKGGAMAQAALAGQKFDYTARKRS